MSAGQFNICPHLNCCARRQTLIRRNPFHNEFRANQAFNRGQYSAALPVLQQLSEVFKDQPSRLGPIQEKIHVCETALASLQATPQVLPPPDLAPAKARTPHAAPKPGEVLEMEIKELGNFKFDADRGGNIPADVKVP